MPFRGAEPFLTGGARLLLVGFHIAALNTPLIALPFQRVVHRDGLQKRLGSFGLKLTLASASFLAEWKPRIDADVHGPDVDFFGYVFENPALL